MEYLAHSARAGRPEQSYRDHVEAVCSLAEQNAQEAARFAVLDGPALLCTTKNASLVHDLGKLHSENQDALHRSDVRAHLPINHVDAGVACLKRMDATFNAQMAVYSHHHGLPDMVEESLRQDYFRDGNARIRERVNADLPNVLRCHEGLIPERLLLPAKEEIRGDPGVFYRIMLSCLADADHSDTAAYYGEYPLHDKEPALLPRKRLEKLSAYVDGLGGNDNERSRLRREMYDSCMNAMPNASIVSCDSPVGSGKTTAVMAHLLRQAIERGARRIFIVLPFTNIIQQSVQIYRKALVLPGEDPERVVAELHHRADFQNMEARSLTAQWRAPIIVTTAVAFFETLASNRPSALRRLHELPGSLVFVDEAHAALPVKLLPLAWRWIQTLADEWQCYWVFASGSLVRFWELEADGWEKERRDVPSVLSEDLRIRLMQYENKRIQFRYETRPLSRTDLISKVVFSPGPRLLIMNTVQSAAVIARDMQALYGNGGKGKVMHLSTALNAEDRDRTVKSIRERLLNTDDTDWTLVATSCVEAGVDFSFQSGFRELSSLLSLLQTAGRINRNGDCGDSVVWSFEMQDDSLLARNKGVEVASQILKGYFNRGAPIKPSLSTRSMEDELKRSVQDFDELLKAEENGRFPVVEKKFKVIEDNTVLAVADSALKEQIKNGTGNWRDIQRKAVSIPLYRAKKMQLNTLAEGIYDWDADYDDFLGIMKGVLGQGVSIL